MRRVLSLPAYRRLLAAFALNELAWTVGTLALSVLVYRRTGSALGSAAFFLTSMVLPAFASPFVVARVDQRTPRRLLPLLYLAEGLLFGVLALLTSRFSLVPVLVLTLVDGIVAIVARALARAAAADVLRPVDLLHEGNAITNSAFSVCFMAGPAIGGVVVAAGGTIAALLVNCGLFALIALILATASGLPEGTADREPSAGRLRAALSHVRKDRAERWLLLLQFGGTIAFTISIPVEVVFAQHTLHTGAAGYGAMLSSWGTGAVVGSAAYARWRRRSPRTLITLSGLALALGFALMAAAPTIAIAVVGTTIGGVGNGVVSVASGTALQEYTPQRWMAMVMSLSQSVQAAAPGFGILLGGGITEISNARFAFAIGSIGSFIFALFAWIVLHPALLRAPANGAAAGDTTTAATDHAPGAGSPELGGKLTPTPSQSRETVA